MKPSAQRMLAGAGVFVVVSLGLAFRTGLGTPASFGLGVFAAICPLAWIQEALASRSMTVPALIGITLVIAITVVLGRVWCGWLCPAQFVRRFLGGRGQAAKDQADKPTLDISMDPEEVQADVQRIVAGERKRVRRASIPEGSDSRYWVLLAVVISTFIFGVPVFCLICPIGLSVGLLIDLWRLIQYNEVTWTILVFPAIIVLEFVIFRRWCHTICPIGILYGLISRLNRTWRPQVDYRKCLRATGIDCKECVKSCPEGIDLHHPLDSADISVCTKCRECVAVCPGSAVSIPFLAKEFTPSSSDLSSHQDQPRR